MGFWLLVPGVGMGGGAAVSVVPTAWFTLDNERPEFTLDKSPEFTLDTSPEFTLDNN